MLTLTLVRSELQLGSRQSGPSKSSSGQNLVTVFSVDNVSTVSLPFQMLGRRRDVFQHFSALFADISTTVAAMLAVALDASSYS